MITTIDTFSMWHSSHMFFFAWCEAGEAGDAGEAGEAREAGEEEGEKDV